MICPLMLSLVSRILSLFSSATNHAFLIDFLQANKSLETLQLEGNYIGDAGAEALAEGLKVVLDAQMLIFRMETCFLLYLLSFPQPFRRCHNHCGLFYKRCCEPSTSIFQVFRAWLAAPTNRVLSIACSRSTSP